MVESRLLPQFELAYGKFSSEYGTSNEDASAFRSMGPEVLQRAKAVLAPLADAQPVLLHGGEESSDEQHERPNTASLREALNLSIFLGCTHCMIDCDTSAFPRFCQTCGSATVGQCQGRIQSHIETRSFSTLLAGME